VVTGGFSIGRKLFEEIDKPLESNSALALERKLIQNNNKIVTMPYKYSDLTRSVW
jgi:hypothetical protein